MITCSLSSILLLRERTMPYHIMHWYDLSKNVIIIQYTFPRLIIRKFGIFTHSILNNILIY